MDQNYPRSPWYDQSLPAPSDGSGKSAAAKKKKKPRTGAKIIGIAVCVLILIAASVIAFGDIHWYFRGKDGTVHSSGDPGIAVNPNPVLPDPSQDGDDYAEDYNDFFADYYYDADKPLPASRIERADTHSECRLELHSAEGKPELSLQELYTACADSVVIVRACSYSSMNLIHSGTGIIVSDSGFIVTNQHIISDTDTATVILTDGTEYPAFLVGEDTLTDIAVLKIPARDLPCAEFGDSDTVQVGDPVAAIGNPLSDQLTGTLTNGIISALNRQISFSGRYLSLLQTSAPINEGNSGGPLFNQYGQVIGITNMKLSNAYSDVTIEGIGFAIPTTTVKTVTDQLIAHGKYSRPALGITVGAIPDEVAEHYGLPVGGLYISEISEGSSAEEQGIQVGDVLTHVNGMEVHVTDDVLAIRDTLAVGDEMTLTIFRDGKTFDVIIILKELSQLY